MYNYRDSKSNIINILKSSTNIEKCDNIPKADETFTYDNGIYAWTGAIFIDIVNSSNLLDKKDEKLARLMRAFTSEIITIFQDFEKYRQIGIRGDCVYAIYSVPEKSDIVEMFRIAYKLNTFLKMFNKIIINYGYSEISAGIGLGCDQDLIIKAGRSGTGINDKIWIGNAIIDACNFASKGSRNGIESIVLSQCVYSNIIEILKKENPNYETWIHSKKKNTYYDSHTVEFYHCNIIQTDFDNWINNGMKE
ncbi:MAG: adenylate cyclase [Clostridia bacterium]|nr:adenylate cyclase [Clostridia bacterium]